MAETGWDPDRYEGDHAFVYEYGEDVVGLLAPEPGERLDGLRVDPVALPRDDCLRVDRIERGHVRLATPVRVLSSGRS